mgnify:CR=1 FL=1
MTRARIAFVAGAIVVIGTIVWGAWQMRAPASDPAAVALMRNAAHAMREVPVKGIVTTRVLMTDGWHEAGAEIHAGHGRARVRYLSGPAEGVTLVRQGRDVWTIGPEGKGLRRVGLGADPIEHLGREMLGKNLAARIVGEQIIAGRPTTVVSARALFGGVRMGLDRENDFPLLIERLGPEGEVRVSTVYDEADFAVEPPAVSEPPEGARRSGHGGEDFTSVAQLKSQVEFTLYVPSYLPSGFDLQDRRLHRGPHSGSVALRYSDGLQNMLIVQRGVGVGTAADGSVREGVRDRIADRRGGQTHDGSGRGRGARGNGHMMHMRGGPGGDAVRRSMDGTVVMVMGGLPKDELARVADSLKPIR